MKFWASNHTDSDDDDDELSQWDDSLFTKDSRLNRKPLAAKACACPLCSGKGWILEVEEPMP